MTPSPSDRSPARLVRVERADEAGAIRGLVPREQFLVLRWPPLGETPVDDAVRAGGDLARDLGARAREARDRMEDRAVQMAKDYDLDPQRARALVRAATGWIDAVTTPVAVAAESADERRALREVAEAAHLGLADWGPRPEPPKAAAPTSRVADVDLVWERRLERRAGEPQGEASEVARSIRGGLSTSASRVQAPVEVARESREERQALMDVAEAAQAGATGWQPREEPPEAAAPTVTVLPEDREPEDVTSRIRTHEDEAHRRKPWEPGAGGP